MVKKLQSIPLEFQQNLNVNSTVIHELLFEFIPKINHKMRQNNALQTNRKRTFTKKTKVITLK